ncbi:hypothetical protein DH2020_042902 [Rehmannia glutinosa]|uniref:U-box domain-containing protein n=1 Tax=Rehmannia glutinosa TaxID=99300 RepID=A0ABR0UL85_REHGL
MTDPVTVSTGQTYDRVSIQKWLKSGNMICPKTGEKLTSTEMVPNTSLKKLIQQFCAEYGVSLAKSRKKNRDISRTILPGSPANGEAIRFLSEFLTVSLGYAVETAERAEINNRKRGLKSIIAVLKSGKKTEAKQIAAATRALSAGAVPILLGLLESSERVELKTDTLAVLSTLADSFEGSMEIVQAGIAIDFEIIEFYRNASRKGILRFDSAFTGMATEQPKQATEEANIDLFEDDDEFEEFEIGQGGFLFLFSFSQNV